MSSVLSVRVGFSCVLSLARAGQGTPRGARGTHKHTSLAGLTCPTCQFFARVLLLILEYVLVLGVGVRYYIQRDAGESVQLLKFLSIDVLVDFFKAVSVRSPAV